MHMVVPSLFMFLFARNTSASVHTEIIQYRQGDVTLEGYLAYDDTIKGGRPGVLVVHEWWGINDYIKRRTEQLAQLGYIAFAADIYGKGIRAKTREEARALAGKFRSGKDRTLLRARVNAGLEILKTKTQVDPKRIAAIGYCFGGTTALELARSGADVAGVVCIHGGLETPNPDDARNIKAKVLVLAGAADPTVRPDHVVAFGEEMDKAGVDWYLVSYGNAVHGFTNPENGADNAQGVAYNEKADKRSWQAMRDFFEEIFR